MTSDWISSVHFAKAEIRHRCHQIQALLALDLPQRSVPWTRQAVVSRTIQDGAIPHLVHQMWVDNRFGRRMRAGILDFRGTNPSHDFALLRDTEAENSLIDVWRGHPALEILRRSRIGPLTVDLWRYMTVYTHGGWYFDIKSRLEDPLLSFEDEGISGVVSLEPFTDPELVNCDSGSGFSISIGAHWLANWGFAFAPKHPFLRMLIEDIVESYPRYRARVFEDPKTAVLDFTGPRRFTRVFRAFETSNPGHSIKIMSANFGGRGTYQMPGSGTRFLTRRSYSAARNQAIVD
jgi:mannosyltransferase OCH1-like enzyme